MFKNPFYIYGPEDRYVPAKLNGGDFILKKISENKETVALINGATNEKLTYGQIAQEAMNLAVSLVKFGIRKGDVVALCSENRREFWSTILGVACTGAVVTTIDIDYTQDELVHVMGISKPKYIFCSPLAHILQGNIYRSLECIEKIIVYGEEKLLNTVLYNDLAVAGPRLKNVKLEEFEPVEVDGQSDLMMILYSSGTTGLPKGIKITHLNILTACASTMDTPPYIALTITPWFRTFGLNSHILMFVRGRTTVYLPKFTVDSFLRTIEKYQISQLTVPPSVLVALCKSPVKYDVSSVTMIISGAAPLRKETADAVLKIFPNVHAVFQGYGLTETTFATTLNTNPDKEGSVGIANPYIVIKIVDKVTGKELGPYEKGEICVKGMIVTKGYIGRKREADFDEEGFFRTGDIGYYDEDKYLYIVDRYIDLIKYKEHQVAPREIEALLLKHDGVSDVGVVGAPDPTAGEVPTVFVVLKPDVRVTEADLEQLVAETLPDPKHLRGGVRFVDKIPKTFTGKVYRRELRKIIEISK